MRLLEKLVVACVMVGAATAASPVFTCAPAGSPHALSVYSDGTYAVSVASASGTTWFNNGTVAVRAAQRWFTSTDSSLALQGAGGTRGAGADGLGAFTTWTIGWATVGAGVPEVPVLTTFKCYAGGMLGFDLTFPEGAQGVNASYVGVNATVGTCQPSTMFPAFLASPEGAPLLSSHLVWWQHGGPWTLYEFRGQGVGKGFQDCQTGPLYVIDPLFAPATGAPAGTSTKPTLAILSPLTHFHSTITAVMPDPASGELRLTMGLSPTALSLPAGYTVSVGLFASTQGWNAALSAWGGQMQALYGTSRLNNPDRNALTTKVSYWSDNGAVYFQGWWDMYCPTRNCSASSSPNPEETFVALKEYHSAVGVPAAIYQLDTWWFEQQADVLPHGDLDCVDWVPRQDMWPHGLPYVTQQAGGIPLLLYSWGFATPAAGNQMTNWTWEVSQNFNNGDMDSREAQVVLDEVYAFYSFIRDRFLAFNGTSMEEDNMGTHTMSYPSHITAVDGVERWWAGFASPWCESSIPMQICEAGPADLLESLKYPCITNSRDNIDNVPGNWSVSNFFSVRWHVGFDRPFMTALGIQPFYDNVWTMPTQPGSSWAPQTEEYLELAWILSTLSAGPVGFSDVINNTNATLVMTCCMADGTILKASTTSSYLDLIFLPPALNPIDVAQGRLFQAHSTVSGPSEWTFTSLLAVDVAGPFPTLPSYFTPDLSPSPRVYVTWTPGFVGVDAACCDGCAGAGCVTAFDASHPITVATGVAPVPWQHAFELYSMSPVLPSGWALVGELHKVVRVSPLRFTGLGVGSAGTGLTVNVTSPGDEGVDVTVLAPMGGPGGGVSIVRVTLPFPAGASSTRTLTCTVDGQGKPGCAW